MNALLFSCLHDNGHGTLTDRAVFTWKSKQYRFVFPKVLVA
jgi:hypothetical protein